MKQRSERYPRVRYERWKTPISNAEVITLKKVMQIRGFAHCFFGLGDKKDERIGVMTTIRRYPFRVIDGEFAKTSVGKYFKAKRTRKKVDPTQQYFTWKLWETNLIEELDRTDEVSGFRPEEHKKLCNYLVIAKNNWVEIVNCAPEWQIYHGVTLEKLIERYMKNEYTWKTSGKRQQHKLRNEKTHVGDAR
jgi:hypothetical protein